MPSTYSPSLRLELIGDGEQDGIWGQTTNNNFGELVEQAIAGITNVNVTAGDVTLTSFNGAVDEARSPVLNVSGTPGVTRNVIIPNHKKTYLVKNTSDAAVGIKTASGSPATVSSNGQSLLVCDGLGTVTNYLESAVITPPFPSGTAMLFVQTTAPTGWTKVTTYNDAALRVVSGAVSAGGATGFATVFSASGVASNSISLTTAQMPSHNHSLSPNFNVNFSQALFDPGGLGFLTSQAGGPTFSISNTGSSDTHYHTTTLNLKYVDTIIATKD
jgi:hypothetical protein